MYTHTTLIKNIRFYRLYGCKAYNIVVIAENMYNKTKMCTILARNILHKSSKMRIHVCACINS